jgi:hypothetical protein
MRKQQLAARLAGLEQAVKSGRSGSAYQPPPAAPSGSQLQTGWLFRSRDEDDLYPAATTLASTASPSRSPVLVAALLPILVPLSAAAMFFAAKGLDVPIEAYLPKQMPQLDSLIPKTDTVVPTTESLLLKTDRLLSKTFSKSEAVQASKPPPPPPAPANPTPSVFSYFGFR